MLENIGFKSSIATITLVDQLTNSE